MPSLPTWLWPTLGALIVLSIAAFAAWRLFTGPMFRPGSVATRPDLDPVPGPVDAPWQVQPHVTLAHISAGSGPPLLVVHGGPGIAPTRLAPGLEALTNAFSVHAFHQRGCGDSSRLYNGATTDNTYANIQALESTLGVGAQLADIERIRRLLGEERLLLVGHSYGALLAALYAAEFPDHVAALVLVAPADMLLFPSPHGGLFDQMRAALPADQHAAFDAWKADYLDLSGVFAKTTADLQALDTRFIELYQAAAGPLDAVPDPGHLGVWHARAQYFSGGMRHDWRPALARIQARTLVIHGSQDLQPEDVARMYTHAIPDSHLETIDGAGHVPWSSHPDAFDRLVRAFLRAR